MRTLLIGLLVVIFLLFVMSTEARACDQCQKPAVVKSLDLPGYVLPVRFVVLDKGVVVPKRPVVLAVRKVIHKPVVVVRRAVRVPVVVARRVLQIPKRVLHRVFH